MKNKIIMLSLMVSGFAYSQLAIGLNQTSNSSISLEFGNENRGIILPWTYSDANLLDAENGTIIYDVADFKVKVKYATGWEDLSVDGTGTTVNPITNLDGLILQNDLIENTDAKVGIGAETSVDGILVLENTNQAMVLPKVASPHLNILNPSPGMMAYDTLSGQLAVFNGSVWTFWKP
jgi:hypothetical protein